jgi:hypothetical protein
MKSLPEMAQEEILEDAASRDIVTARRKKLLEILWGERYLTRAGLIARVEAVLGEGCFGSAAWRDTFYRDMSVVKQAYQAAGYMLSYSRSSALPGYYLREQPGLHTDLADLVKRSVAEVDLAQIAIYRQLRPDQRFFQGKSITDLARRVVAHRNVLREAAHE